MPKPGFVTKRGFAARLSEVYTEPNTGCWLWPGCINSNGYGLTISKGVQKLAHRVSYEHHVGPIPDGAVVMHICDVPLCVNPSHLRVGTQVDNIADMHTKGRRKYQRGLGLSENIRGEFNPQSSKGRKLPEHHVIAIFNDSRPQSAIALEYGVSQSMVSSIQTGKTWKRLLASKIGYIG